MMGAFRMYEGKRDMISFRSAAALALARNMKYDYYREYKDVYAFSIYGAEDMIGGFDMPIFIAKQDGDYTDHAAITLSLHLDWLDDKHLISEGNIYERLRDIDIMEGRNAS